jgi:hypothetical protein
MYVIIILFKSKNKSIHDCTYKLKMSHFCLGHRFKHFNINILMILKMLMKINITKVNDYLK